MEQPFIGCSTDDDHHDGCLLDVLAVLEQLRRDATTDAEVTAWWDANAPRMHLCHLRAAVRQLAGFANMLGIQPGDIAEHIAATNVNVMAQDWPP